MFKAFIINDKIVVLFILLGVCYYIYFQSSSVFKVLTGINHQRIRLDQKAMDKPLIVF